jgi:hypothetical protein
MRLICHFRLLVSSIWTMRSLLSTELVQLLATDVVRSTAHSPAFTRHSLQLMIEMVDWGRGYGATTPLHLGL